jgi:hypothetical protein
VGAERSEDLRQNAFGVRQYIVVPEAEDSPALSCKMSVARFVAQGVGVLSAIDFDDHTCVDAGEIDDVGRNRMLTAESPSAELVIAKAGP